nr:hypothetical protein [Alicyclobacillus contaminans]
MRLRLKHIAWMLASLMIVGIGYLSTFHPSSNVPKDYTLPNDNFDTATMQQIEADLQQYQVAQNPHDHEVYMVTGGLGVENPTIMSWDSDGNMTFGFYGPPGEIFEIQETGQDPRSWKRVIPQGKPDPKTKQGVTFTYKPLHWIEQYSSTGQVYYKLVPLQATLIFFCSRRRLAFRLCLLRQRIYARIASASALWSSWLLPLSTNLRNGPK